MPIYGELGRYPLSITIKQRMVCYWTRLLKSNQHKLNKVMYDLHCKDIHSSGWIKYINTIFQNNGMSYIWATQDFNVDSNNVYKCECDQFKQLWHSRITCDAIDSNNMMYETFKYSHGKEKYTEILPEHFKKAFLQFRIGSHKLPVNNRKHFNVPNVWCPNSVMFYGVFIWLIFHTNVEHLSVSHVKRTLICLILVQKYIEKRLKH